MKHFYRTRDRPSNPFKQPFQRKERNAYHRIENAMASAQTVPSLANKASSDAPTYTLRIR